MTMPPFRFETLGAAHDRGAFRCGEAALDRHFQTHATQDIRRRVASCSVVVETLTGQVAAYYTLSAASVPLVDLQPEETKHLPRYPTLPAVRIGRLAVDQRFQKRGLGTALLADAALRTLQAPPAVPAFLVDAKNDGAVAFYERYGFRVLVGRPRTLFLLLATARRVLPE